MGQQDSSPFDRVRVSMGLSHTDFAELLGCSLPTIYNASRGWGNLPRGAYQGLREIGIDPEALARDHALWIEARGARRRAALHLAATTNST